MRHSELKESLIIMSYKAFELNFESLEDQAKPDETEGSSDTSSSDSPREIGDEEAVEAV